MIVSGMMYGCLLFAYLYLWIVSPQLWPTAAPSTGPGLASAGLYILASLAVVFAGRQLAKRDRCWGLLLAIALLVAAVAAGLPGFADVTPSANAYGAAVYAVLAINGFFAVVVIAMAAYCLARGGAGLLDRHRRVTFDNTRIFWHYIVVQSLIGTALVYGFPRLVG
jgi:heme/copper-type cytochrome/quinol oxidase subunit 3